MGHTYLTAETLQETGFGPRVTGLGWQRWLPSQKFFGTAETHRYRERTMVVELYVNFALNDLLR